MILRVDATPDSPRVFDDGVEWWPMTVFGIKDSNQYLEKMNTTTRVIIIQDSLLKVKGRDIKGKRVST